MDYKYVKSNCCTKECTWEEKCHKITINDITLTEPDLIFLATIRVHTLDLYNNNIGAKGAKYLSSNKTIHTLNLWDNNIGAKGAK